MANKAIRGVVAIVYFIIALILVFFMNLILIMPTIEWMFPITDAQIGWMNFVGKAGAYIIYIVILFIVPYLFVTQEEE